MLPGPFVGRPWNCVGLRAPGMGGGRAGSLSPEDVILFPTRYLLHQLWLAAVQQEASIFSPGTEPGMWILRPHITFIFFSSHTPCEYVELVFGPAG